jgi:hypothetical protein
MIELLSIVLGWSISLWLLILIFVKCLERS